MSSRAVVETEPVTIRLQAFTIESVMNEYERMLPPGTQVMLGGRPVRMIVEGLAKQMYESADEAERNFKLKQDGRQERKMRKGQRQGRGRDFATDQAFPGAEAFGFSENSPVGAGGGSLPMGVPPPPAPPGMNVPPPPPPSAFPSEPPIAPTPPSAFPGAPPPFPNAPPPLVQQAPGPVPSAPPNPVPAGAPPALPPVVTPVQSGVVPPAVIQAMTAPTLPPPPASPTSQAPPVNAAAPLANKPFDDDSQ